MNTKKIMALTLAALMAAGSTSTVFAAKSTDALDFIDATAYESKDGVLVEDTDGIAPGDTVYYRLDEDLSAEDKDKDRLNVYADWKVGGDNVESIDIVYKKGNFQSTGNQQSTGFKYELDAGSSALDGVKVFVSGAKMDNATDEATKTALKAAITEEQFKAAAATDYEKKDGYVIGGKYYATTATAEEVLTDLGGWSAGDGFSVTDAELTEVGTGYGTYTTGSGSETLTTDYYTKNIAGTDYYIDTTDSTGVDTVAKLVAAKEAGFAALADVEMKTVDAENTVYVDGTDVKTYEEVKELLKAEVTGYQNTPEEQYGAKDGYTYWVEVKTKDNDTTKVLDVAGTLYIGTTKNKAEDESNDNKLSVSLELSNRNTDYYNPTPVEDEATIEPDANGAVKFSDDAEEVTIYFGSNEDAWYTFNAKGQSDVNFAYTMKFNSEIADLFPKANIDFITWTATPATNRTGDLYITADEDTFLYEVTEDGIKEVNGAEYDEDEGAWHIRTRKLTAYAISDIELDTSVKLDNDSSSSTSSGSNTDGGKDNPDTGR